MKFKYFKKFMKKPVFTWQEAKVVAFQTDPGTLKLQLHQWKKAGDILSLKRGVYAFSNQTIDQVEVAKHLYAPCYVSLETALNYYGLLPDVTFAMTLVTTKATRKINTPVGQFTYQKIKKSAFQGYDPQTLMAEREKAVVDYLYLNQRHFYAKVDFWETLRWQHLGAIKFKRAMKYAVYFKSGKLDQLLRSLRSYAKLNQTT